MLASELPYAVVPIDNPTSSSEDRAVDLFADIKVVIKSRSGIPNRPWIYGVIFVVRLGIERGFDWHQPVVASNGFPDRNVVSAAMTGLHGIEVKPLFIVEKGGGGHCPALWVVGDELGSPSFSLPASHGSPDWCPIAVRR